MKDTISKPIVLIVDDEPMVRQTLLRAFQGGDFECRVAENGRDALSMVRAGDFSLVVTDLRMPDTNGHRLAVHLLGLANPPSIIVLTGVLEPRIVNDLLRRGVDAVMLKPVDMEEVIETAQRILKSKTSSTSKKSLPATFDEMDSDAGGESDHPSMPVRHAAPSAAKAEQRAVRLVSFDRDHSDAYVVESRRILLRCAIALADLRCTLDSIPRSNGFPAFVVLLIGVFVGAIVTCFVSWWHLTQ